MKSYVWDYHYYMLYFIIIIIMIIFCYIRTLLSVDIVKKNMFYITFCFIFVLGSKEQTELLIKQRGENDHLLTGGKNSATAGWR